MGQRDGVARGVGELEQGRGVALGGSIRVKSGGKVFGRGVELVDGGLVHAADDLLLLGAELGGEGGCGGGRRHG